MKAHDSSAQLLVIFLAIPNLALSDPVCTHPYECLTLIRCADVLSPKAAEEVLFRCGPNKVCCPPARTANTYLSHTERITETTTIGKFPTKYSAKKPETQAGTSTVTCPSCSQVHEDTFTSPKAPLREVPTSRFASHRNFRLLPTNCGLNDLPNRITEGEEANLGEFPWMALVGVKDKLGNLKWFCGGTLITPRYVLTAAHCVFGEEGSTPMVRLGEHNLENATDCDKINNFCLDPPLDFNIEEIIVHKGWNKSTIKNDIALYRLSKAAHETFSVLPICLPTDIKPRNSSEDVRYEVAGWGKTDWNAQPGSSVLRKGTLSSVANGECNLCKSKQKERYCPITEKQMCAQGWKSVDVCKGDSGGPLMSSLQRIYQVGITSFKASEYCGADNIPSVFTRVESYMNWILDNIKE